MAGAAGASPAATIVVPARNASATLGRTLDSLSRQVVDRPFDVIVVDDGSDDETAKLAENHQLRPRVLRGAGGRGAGAARNAAAATTGAPVLAFTDADCMPAPDWLAQGLSAIETCDLVQGRILQEPGVRAGPFDRTLNVQTEYGLYETANLFVRRDVFAAIGGFLDFADTEQRPFGEDTLFAWRARRTGARARFSADALVYHAVFPGRARTFIRERARRRGFPGLVAQIPELRELFLHRRVFLNSTTAAFDAALAGTLLSVMRRSPLPLVLAAPYLKVLTETVQTWREQGEPGPFLTLAYVLGDVVTFGALITGSIAARCPVL